MDDPKKRKISETFQMRKLKDFVLKVNIKYGFRMDIAVGFFLAGYLFSRQVLKKQL